MQTELRPASEETEGNIDQSKGFLQNKYVEIVDSPGGFVNQRLGLISMGVQGTTH
jgi:hypothetical protein